MAPSGKAKLRIANAYADGACLRNGEASAVASVGVYVMEDRSLGVSELVGRRLPQSAQVAELLAVFRALYSCRGWDEITVHTDSEYCVTCINELYPQWSLNGWRKPDGSVPPDLVIVRAIALYIRDLEAEGKSIRIRKVKGHSGDEGNSEAHRLAHKAFLKKRKKRDPAGTKRLVQLMERVHQEDGIRSNAGAIVLPSPLPPSPCSSSSSGFLTADEGEGGGGEEAATEVCDAVADLVAKLRVVSSRLNTTALELTEVSRGLEDVGGRGQT